VQSGADKRIEINGRLPNNQATNADNKTAANDRAPLNGSDNSKGDLPEAGARKWRRTKRGRERTGTFSRGTPPIEADRAAERKAKSLEQNIITDSQHLTDCGKLA